ILNVVLVFGVLRAGEFVQGSLQDRIVSSFFSRLIFRKSVLRLVLDRRLLLLGSGRSSLLLSEDEGRCDRRTKEDDQDQEHSLEHGRSLVGSPHLPRSIGFTVISPRTDGDNPILRECGKSDY